MSFFSDLFAGGSNKKSADDYIPQFKTDPYYTSSQDTLDKFSKDLLSGNLNDYYKPLGQPGSNEFKSMLDSVTKNIQGSVTNSMANAGTLRSGGVGAATSDALAQYIPQLSYQDYLQAMNNRMSFMDKGLSTQQNINTNSRNQEGMVNNYNLAKGQFDFNFDQNAAKEQGSLWGTIGSGVLGAIEGGVTGGPMGAVAGGLGGALGQTSSISNFLDMLGKSKQGTGAPASGTTSNSPINSTLGSFNDDTLGKRKMLASNYDL